MRNQFRFTSGVAFGLAGVLLATACSRVEPGPEPTISIETPERAPERSTAFFELAKLTIGVSKYSIRKQEMSELVDVEIAAMDQYVRRHGRGQADLPKRTLVDRKEQEIAEAERLVASAEALMGCLPLDAAPESFAMVATEALAMHLGSEAMLVKTSPFSVADHEHVTAEIRDGLALLAIHEFSRESEGQLTTLFTQWSSLSTKPRAVVVDLSACVPQPGPGAAALLVNALAPGKPAFVVASRNGETGEVERRLWAGPAAWGKTSLSEIPVFVIVSEETTELAEAVAHALRVHRSAKIIGRATRGSGTVTYWSHLPWDAWFGVTIAELSSPGGTSLRGHPVVPDLCVTRGGIVPLASATEEIYRATCGEAPPALDKGEILEEVRRLLDAGDQDRGKGADARHGQKQASLGPVRSSEHREEAP